MAKRALEMLLKVESGSVFETIMGLRNKRVAFNGEQVDVTNSDDTSRWRQLLENAGVKSAAISGSGVFKDAASDEIVRAAFFAGDHLDYQVFIPGFGTVQAAFQIASLEYGGEHNGEITHDISLESAGDVAFQAAA